MHLAKQLIAITVLVLAAAPALAGHTGADEKAIAARNVQWLAAVAAGDSEAISNLYAPDGLFMPTGAPPVEGRAAVAEAWAGLLAIPGVALTFATTRLEVAE
jgi:ketosteroid isomerase-like protein